MEQSLLDYIEFINEQVQRYKEYGLAALQSIELTIDDVNDKLLQYDTTTIMLIAEYNRKKAEQRQVEGDYQAWWDQKFIETKREMIADRPDKEVSKIALKEYETQARYNNSLEYRDWQDRIFKVESEVSFLQRKLNSWEKVHDTLVTISYNIRSEMKSIGMVDRANSNNCNTNINNRPKRKREEANSWE